MAQVLQRRQNHATFDVTRVSVDDRPDLARKFHVAQVPTICIVEHSKLELSIVSPRGCRDLERQLGPWLR